MDPPPAEPASTEGSATGAVPGGAPAVPAAVPRVVPWLLLYTLGRLALAAALVALVWVAGLPGFPALLFGVLLSMPAAFLLLRPARDRLTAALAARQAARATARADLRARLQGSSAD